MTPQTEGDTMLSKCVDCREDRGGFLSLMQNKGNAS